MTEPKKRQALLDAALAMNDRGLNHGSSGNISVRAEGGMLITPSALPYDRMNPEDMAFVDWGGVARGPRKPSSEWRMHLDVYRAFFEAQAVLHAHALWCTTLACLERGIPSQHYMIAMAGGADILCTPYAPFGTPELSASALAGLSGGRRAVLLGHHGLLCYGESLAAVLALAEEVEFLARVYAQSLQINPEPPLLAREHVESQLARFAAYKKLAAE